MWLLTSSVTGLNKSLEALQSHPTVLYGDLFESLWKLVHGLAGAVDALDAGKAPAAPFATETPKRQSDSKLGRTRSETKRRGRAVTITREEETKEVPAQKPAVAALLGDVTRLFFSVSDVVALLLPTPAQTSPSVYAPDGWDNLDFSNGLCVQFVRSLVFAAFGDPAEREQYGTGLSPPDPLAALLTIMERALEQLESDTHPFYKRPATQQLWCAQCDC